MEPSGEGSLGNMQISLGSSKYLRYLTGGFRVGDGVSKRAMREGVQISCYGTIGNRTARTLQVYERQAELFLSQWGRHRCRVPPLLRVLLKGMPKGSRLLDMGCGPAQDTLYLSARGYRSIGLDATWAFLRWAREKSPSAPLVQADLRRLPFTPGRFDAVWSAASLIHLSKAEVRRVLVALYGIVTSGGRLAATLAHGTFSGVASHGWLPGRYISRWTKADLARVVTRAGWRIELLTTVSNQERKGRWLNLLARRPFGLKGAGMERCPMILWRALMVIAVVLLDVAAPSAMGAELGWCVGIPQRPSEETLVEQPVQMGVEREVREGVFLVSDPRLADPNFDETVVLVIHHGPDGTLGVIINRPTKTHLSRLLPDIKELKNRSDPLYLGGPVLQQALVMLFRTDTHYRSMALVFDNVYFGQSIDALTDMLAGLGPKDAFRVYAGHAGWAPGQLQGELDLGAWRILRGDSNVVFEKDSAAVWPVMIRRSSEQYIKGFNRPFDQGCLPRPISLSR